MALIPGYSSFEDHNKYTNSHLGEPLHSLTTAVAAAPTTSAVSAIAAPTSSNPALDSYTPLSPNEDNQLGFLDLNASDQLGRTALHWAAATDQPEMIKYLLQSGIAYDAQTVLEETALALACKEGALSSCELLVLAGVNPDLTDYLDRTPKDLALQNGHQDIYNLLDNMSNLSCTSHHSSFKYQLNGCVNRLYDPDFQTYAYSSSSCGTKISPSQTSTATTMAAVDTISITNATLATSCGQKAIATRPKLESPIATPTSTPVFSNNTSTPSPPSPPPSTIQGTYCVSASLVSTFDSNVNSKRPIPLPNAISTVTRSSTCVKPYFYTTPNKIPTNYPQNYWPSYFPYYHYYYYNQPNYQPSARSDLNSFSSTAASFTSTPQMGNSHQLPDTTQLDQCSLDSKTCVYNQMETSMPATALRTGAVSESNILDIDYRTSLPFSSIPSSSPPVTTSLQLPPLKSCEPTTLKTSPTSLEYSSYSLLLSPTQHVHTADDAEHRFHPHHHLQNQHQLNPTNYSID